MSEENDYLLKYFFLMGVPENITSTLKLSPLDRNNTITPSLLSSYSAEGMTDLFKLIQKELNNDQYLRDNIFPKKSNFLSDIEFPEDINEPPSLQLKTNPFNDYLYEAEKFALYFFLSLCFLLYMYVYNYYKEVHILFLICY